MKIVYVFLMLATSLFSDANWSAWKEKVLKSQSQLPGWCKREKANQMMDLIYEIHPECCVEVGVFGGSSLFPTACALAFIGKGVAYGIDPWATENCLVGYDSKDPNYQWWSQVNLEEIYQCVVKTIGHWRLEPYCKLMRTTGYEAIATFADNSIDILHIDGNHTEQEALQDAKLYLPKVKKGGYIWFDDTDWASTSKAITWLCSYCEIDQKRSTSSYLLLKRIY